MLTKPQAEAIRNASGPTLYRDGRGAGSFNSMIRRMVANLLLEETAINDHRSAYRRTGLGEDALDLYDAAKGTATADGGRDG